MTTFISKETTKRLAKDVKQIMKYPLTDNGIYYAHDDVNILKGYALIIGTKETPYFAGNYFFEFVFPVDYPYSPPVVTYYTNGNNIRFHPNLYKTGKVCVSLLNTWNGEQWTSCQTISTILLTLCSLLTKDPLLNEPGVNKGHVDLYNYTAIIEYSNIDIAICDIVSKNRFIYNSFFDKFYPIVEENFLKNYNDIVQFIEDKIKTTEKCKIKTQLYCMMVEINYTKLLKKIKDIYTEKLIK
jgi:ubiquitin-protein ligase